MEESSTKTSSPAGVEPNPNYGGLIMGLLALIASVIFFLNISDHRILNLVFGTCCGLLSLNLLTYPFRKQLKKHLVTHLLYWLLQIVSMVGIVIILATVVFGMSAVPIMLCVVSTSILISKTLNHFEIPNHDAIGLFVSFTTTAIAFSFYGNTLIRLFNRWVIEGGDKRKSNEWTKYTRIFFGEGQIRYFVYCLYFLLIIVFTIMDLIGKFPSDNDQNFMFLTLQSFAAFLAFDTIAEKRALMKPWIMLSEMVRDGLKKVKNSTLNELLEEIDEEKTNN